MDNTPLLDPSGGEHDASATAASSSSNPTEKKKPGMMKARWKNIVKTKVEPKHMGRQLLSNSTTAAQVIDNSAFLKNQVQRKS